LQDNPLTLNGDTFPLLKIGECDRQGPVYQSSSFSINIHGAILGIKGRDLKGSAWEADASFNGPGCEIFIADLGANGKQDLIIRTPGIGSRGNYETNLSILLFDSNGDPVPWSATGLFNLNNKGIIEISKSAGGEAMILHNYLVGHPAWGGVSYISALYKVADASVNQIVGSYSGIEFPKIVGSGAVDPVLQKTVRRMNLSTIDTSQKTAADAQTTLPHFIRYGSDVPEQAKLQSAAPLTAEQGANLTIDVETLNASAEHIMLSDGSKLDIPTILIVDSVSGVRKIIFAPDSTDIAPLEKVVHNVQQMGTDCPDSDDCHPFILRFAEQRP